MGGEKYGADCPTPVHKHTRTGGLEGDSHIKQVKNTKTYNFWATTERNVENREQRCVCTTVKAVKLTYSNGLGSNRLLEEGIMGSAREVVEKGTPEP